MYSFEAPKIRPSALFMPFLEQFFFAIDNLCNTNMPPLRTKEFNSSVSPLGGATYFSTVIL
jgi:hypothetical protein